MRIAAILKFAFIMSVVMYGVVAIIIAGQPDWSRPVVPDQPGAALLFGILAFMALAGWGAGLVVGRMAEAPPAFRQATAQNPWSRLRFILAAALLESGAIVGLVLSILNRDSRFAIATAAFTAVLLAMTPASDAARG